MARRMLHLFRDCIVHGKFFRGKPAYPRMGCARPLIALVNLFFGGGI